MFLLVCTDPVPFPFLQEAGEERRTASGDREAGRREERGEKSRDRAGERTKGERRSARGGERGEKAEERPRERRKVGGTALFFFFFYRKYFTSTIRISGGCFRVDVEIQ